MKVEPEVKDSFSKDYDSKRKKREALRNIATALKKGITWDTTITIAHNAIVLLSEIGKSLVIRR
jgi:hypothetical protein